MTRADDSHRVVRTLSRVILALCFVGVLAVPAIATATSGQRTRRHRVNRTRTSTETVLTGYSGRFGLQLTVEQKGQKLALFLFGNDSPSHSACYRACAKTWYPLIDHGKIVVKTGSHINKRQLKTFKRKDGSEQIEYYGQPLYRCHKNTKTGQLYGAGDYEFGNAWEIMGAGGGALQPETPTYGQVHEPQCPRVK